MAGDNGYDPTRSPPPIRWCSTGIASTGIDPASGSSSARASVTAIIFIDWW